MGISHDDAASYAEGIRRGGVLVTVRAGDSDVAERAANIMDDHGAEDIDKHVAEWKTGGWTGAPSSGMESRPERMEARETPQAMETGQQSIPVMEGRLKCSKRESPQGGVRVFTHVTEKPVEETVDLREERVNMERRSVDRHASESEFAAFSEGTIEFPEVYEEPVIENHARVVEEAVTGKQIDQHPETIRDSVRRTDADVEQMGESKSGLEYDTDFRRHYESRYATSGSPYEQYAPAYNYGSSVANDSRYNQREWGDVETDAKQDWETREHGRGKTSKDAIRHGWDRVRGRR